jgi:uncharacterized membrane protein YphA (DoxX/SURF4 family)
MTYVVFTSRCVLGLVFAVSAFGKLRGFAGFRAGLAAMGVLPAPAVGPVAVLVVALEVAVPLLLIPNATVPSGLALSALLLAGFGAAIAVTLRRGTGAACPCFGPASRPFGRRHLLRNGLLVVLALAGLLAGGGTPPVAGAALSAVAGLLIGVLVITFDDLSELFAGPVRR